MENQIRIIKTISTTIFFLILLNYNGLAQKAYRPYKVSLPVKHSNLLKNGEFYDLDSTSISILYKIKSGNKTYRDSIVTYPFYGSMNSFIINKKRNYLQLTSGIYTTSVLTSFAISVSRGDNTTGSSRIFNSWNVPSVVSTMLTTFGLYAGVIVVGISKSIFKGKRVKTMNLQEEQNLTKIRSLSYKYAQENGYIFY
jgi:hypothetical protein